MSLEKELAAGPEGTATAVPQLRLLVPPDPREARAVRDRVASFSRTLGMGEDALQDVLTVIGEAFANAVQHARTREPIELTAWFEDDSRFLASIVDHGRGFADGSDARPAEVLAECGRGMWIMNSCSDSLSVESLPGVGTAIVFARTVRGGSKATRRNR